VTLTVRLTPALGPDVSHDFLEQPEYSWGDRDRAEEILESLLQQLFLDTHCSATRAPIVGVAGVPTLRPAAGQRLFAALAAHESPQREVRIVAFVRDQPRPSSRQNILDSPVSGCVDEGLKVARTRARAQLCSDYLIKEFEDHLRGRQPGEVPALLEREFRELGASDEQLARVDSEIAAARMALEWAQPGDLVLLLVHSRRDSVLSLLRREAEA